MLWLFPLHPYSHPNDIIGGMNESTPRTTLKRILRYDLANELSLTFVDRLWPF